MALFKDSFFNMFGKTFKSIAAVVFVMILTRLLTETEYGTYRQVMLIANTINLLLLLGINETISYHYQIMEKGKRDQMITSMVVFKLICAVPIVLSMFLFKNAISTSMNNPELKNIMWMVVAITFIFILASILENYYLGAGRAVLLSKLQMLSYTIHYALAIFIILKFENVYYIILEIVIFEFIKTIFLFVLIFKLEKFSYDFNFQNLKEMLTFALPIGVSLIVITINQNVDQVMINFFYTPADYAIYNNGAMNIPIVQLLTISVGAVVLPKLSAAVNEDGFKKGIQIWRTASTNTALVLFTFMCMFLIFADGYVTFIFSEKYLDAVPIMRVYLLRMLTTFTLFSSLLLVLNRKKVIAYISVIGLVLNIILNYVFIQIFGMVGAAISTLVVQYIISILEVSFAVYYGKIKVTEIVEFKKIAIILIITGGLAVIYKTLATTIYLGSVWNFFIYGSLYCLSAFGIFILTKQVDQSVIDMVLNKVKRKRGSV